MRAYFLGFLVCIVLTLAAYFVVASRAFSSDLAVVLVVVGSIVQMVVQFVCFLRLGEEPVPEGAKSVSFENPTRWNLIFFLFTVLIAVVVAFGSIWIMYNLNYRM